MLIMYSIGLKRSSWHKWRKYGFEQSFGNFSDEYLKNYHGCETIEQWLEANPDFCIITEAEYIEFCEKYQPTDVWGKSWDYKTEDVITCYSKR